MKRLLFILALALSGCANLNYHLGDKSDPWYRPYPYRSTKEVSQCIAQIFVEMPEWHDGSSAEAAYSHALCVLLSPVLVVDWPLEVVADTVTLPYDVYKEITK